MFSMVRAIILPELTGAVFPGRDNAHIALRPSLPAASISIPPGFEALSLILI